MDLKGTVTELSIPTKCDNLMLKIDGLVVTLQYSETPIHTLNCGSDEIHIYMKCPPREFNSWYVRFAKWIEAKLVPFECGCIKTDLSRKMTRGNDE